MCKLSTPGPVSVLKDSMVISGANGLDLASVLITDALSAAYFGLSAEMDAYLVAAAVPQVLWSVCSSVSTRALVPLFIKTEQETIDNALPRVLGALIVYGFALALLLALVVTFTFGMLGLFSPVPDASLTQLRMKWSFFLILLSVGPSLVTEPLRAAHLVRRRFVLASLADVIRHSVVILSLLIFGRTAGVVSLAVGHLIGSLAQILWLGGAYFAAGERFILKADAQILAEVRVAQRLSPAFVGELIGQGNIPIERFLGSFLPVGTISALGYGRRILRALQTLLVSSVGFALLPGLSKQALTRETLGLTSMVRNGVKLATVAAGLATVLVIDLRLPITALLFERGLFDRSASLLTSRYVAVFVPSVLFMSATYLLINVLFALDESRTVMRLRMAFLGIYLILAVVLSIARPQTGLAYAYTISQSIYFAVTGTLLARRLPGFGPELVSHMVRIGAGITITLLGVAAARHLWLLLGGQPGTGTLYLLASGMIALPIYAMLMIVLQILGRDDLKRWLGRHEGVAPHSS